jgi:hypothetical protein
LTTSDSVENEKQARKERLAAIRAQRGMATAVPAADKKPESTVAVKEDGQKDAFADLRIKERN